MRELICPECGSPLSIEILQEEGSGNIVVNLFCESPTDDEYYLRIDTKLWNEEFFHWDKIGSIRKADMTLVNRKPDPFYKLDKKTLELIER
jgi:hypothetical protein